MAEGEKLFIEFEVRGDGTLVAAAQRASKAVDLVDDSARKAGTGLGVMERAIGKATAVGTFLGNMAYDVGARLVSGFASSISQSISMAARLQTTLAGLTSVAGAFGVGADQAKQAALALSEDGLMKVDEAAAGLKNLLATGFSLPESIRLMQVFKDSAAFGAQGMYTMGQAAVRATEGIKFGNSALTDSTGLGKNLSVIMREAGLSETMAGQAASNHAVRRAILNGFLKEGALFTGQAEVKSKTFSGQQERLANTYDLLLASIGSYIVENKAVVDLLSLLGDKLVDLMNWLSEAGRGYDIVTTAIGWVVKGMDLLLLAVDLGVRGWNLTNIAINGTVAAFAEAGKAILGYQLSLLKAIAAVPGATTVMQGLDDAIGAVQGAHDLASSAAFTYGEAAKANTKVILEGNPAIAAMRKSLGEAATAIEAARGKTVELGESKKRDTNSTNANASAHKKGKSDLDQYKSSLINLNTEVKAAVARKVPLVDIIKKYGDQAVKAATDSKFFGINIRQAAQAVDQLAEATRKLRLKEAIGDAMKEAAQVARTQADAIFESMRKAATKGLDDLNAAIVSNHQTVAAAEAKVIEQRKRATLDETQFKIWQLRQEEAAVIASLNNKDAKYQEHVDAVKSYYEELVQSTLGIQTKTRDWGDELERVLGFMSQIAQASGSKVLGNMVGLMGTIATGNKFNKEFKSNWGIAGGFSSIDPKTGGRDINWTNVAAAGVGVAAGAQGVWQATDVAGRGNRAWGGAKAGAQVGAMFGPWGALIGMGVGALVGALRNPGFEQEMKRIAKNFGVNISEELAREIDKAKKKFGGDRQATEIAYLDRIVGEAGGVTDKNIGQLLPRLRDVFVMLETGKFTAEQAKETLEKSFPAFAQYIQNSTRVASAAFVEILHLNKRFGLESKAILDFVKGEAANVGDGLAGLAQPLMEKYGGLAERISTLRTELEGASNAGRLSAEEMAKGQAELARLTQLQAEGAAKAKDELADLGAIAVGAYNAAKDAGLTEYQAVQQMMAGLGTLKQLYTDLGLEIEDEHLKGMLAYAEKVEANKTLVGQADLLNQTMLATSRIGGLNADSFAAFQRQGLRTYDRLREAGFSENESLSIMRDYLEQVQNAHKDLGLPIDENTQRLLDQAGKAGILKGAQQSMTDVMKEGLGAIIELLGGKLPEAWQKAKDATAQNTVAAQLDRAKLSAENLKKEVIDVGRELDGLNNRQHDYQIPGGGGDYPTAHTGGFIGGRGSVLDRYHKGGVAGLGPDEVPAILQAGEFVISRAAVNRVGRGMLKAINRGEMVGVGASSGVPAAGDSVSVGPFYIEGYLDSPAAQDRLARKVTDQVWKRLRQRRVG